MHAPFSHIDIAQENLGSLLMLYLYEPIKKCGFERYNLDDVVEWAGANVDIMFYVPQMMKTLKARYVILIIKSFYRIHITYEILINSFL